MDQATYDDIAEWYDAYLRENPMYREVVFPQLLKLVGEIQGQVVCDLACGQGWIARELARRGARVTGIDQAENLLALARRAEEQEPLGIVYVKEDAQRAESLHSGSFDGCVCVLALMLFADLPSAFQTMHRLLKPGGWLVFVITHPCFETPHAQWMTTAAGATARVVQGYLQERFWSSSSGGVRSRVGEYHRMLSTYLNTLVGADFAFEQMVEPVAVGARALHVPGNREVPSLLLVRARAV